MRGVVVDGVGSWALIECAMVAMVVVAGRRCRSFVQQLARAHSTNNQHTRGLSVVQATVLGGSSPTRVIMAFDWRYYLPKIIIQWSHWARMMGQAAAQCTCVRVAHGSSRAAPRYQHLEMVHTVAHSLTLIEITCSARVWRLRGVVLSVPVDLDWTLFNVRITEPSQRPRRLLTFGVRPRPRPPPPHIESISALAVFLFPFTWPMETFKEKGWLVLFQNFLAVGPALILYVGIAVVRHRHVA